MHPSHYTSAITWDLFSSRECYEKCSNIFNLKQFDSIYLYLSISLNEKSLGQCQCFIFYFLLKTYVRYYVSDKKLHIFLCCVRRYAWQFREYTHSVQAGIRVVILSAIIKVLMSNDYIEFTCKGSTFVHYKIMNTRFRDQSFWV